MNLADGLRANSATFRRSHYIYVLLTWAQICRHIRLTRCVLWAAPWLCGVRGGWLAVAQVCCRPFAQLRRRFCTFCLLEACLYLGLR